MVLNVHRNLIRLIRDGEKGEGGMEVGGEGDYIPIATLSPPEMIPALRWAAMRAILVFSVEVMDKITRQCPQTTTFLMRKESRSGIATEVLPLDLPNRLTARPNRLTLPLERQLLIIQSSSLHNLS